MTEFTGFYEPTCRVCGCTDDDCYDCYERSGVPCYWVEDDLCSSCEGNDDLEGYQRRNSGLYVPASLQEVNR